MNNIYRRVWNEATGTWQAASENAKGRGKRASKRMGALALLVSGAAALAAPPNPPAPTQLPTGGKVVAGVAAISQAAAVLNVNQSSARAAIDWQTFNVGAAARVNFLQPSASSVTLNRVLDANPSQIFGRISANGQVFLSNPNGVYFSPTSSVDVGGFLATTHAISNADFMAGNYRFARNGASGAILNEGSLNASVEGYIALLAPEVRNQGVIVAQLGTVALAAGEAYDLQMEGDRLAGIRVTPATIAALVENGNAVHAPGGLIILSAQAASVLQGGVVNNTGTLAATGLSTNGGRIFLDSGAGGQTQVSGTLDASAASAKGGRIEVTGERVQVNDGAHLNASGATGGGEILVGGSWQNSDPAVRQAVSTTVAPTARLEANATDVGNGGTVVAWSDISNPDSVTRAYGRFEAKGGPNGGDGGRIETSGHFLSTTGARADASASNGTGGEWLLDPYNITIASSSASGTLYDASYTSAEDSVILASSIQTSLNTGTSVTIQTGSGSAGAGNIVVSSSIAKTGGADATLTLKAHGYIVLANATYLGHSTAAVNSTVAVSSSSNKLNMVINPGTDGSGGFWLPVGSSISTNGGGVTIGGGSDPSTTVAVGTSVSSYENTALSRGVTINGSLAAQGGNIIINGQGRSDDTGRGVSIGGTVSTTGSGTIAIQGTSASSSDGLALGDTTAGGGINGTVSSVNGAITLTGTKGSGPNGINISTASSIVTSTGTGNVTLTATSGDVNTSAGITTTGSGGSILLKATGNVIAAASKTFQTNNGALTFWSDSDASGVGYIQLGNSVTLNTANGATNQTSGGGAITLSGGAALASGYAISTSGAGVALGTSGDNTTNIYSGGGDILIRGRSTSNSGYAAVAAYNTGTINSGSGKVTIVGDHTSASNGHGIEMGISGASASGLTIKSSGGSGTLGDEGITLTGSAASTGDGGGVQTWGSRFYSTGAGGIALTGTSLTTSIRSNSANGGSWGINLLADTSVLAASGPITLNGGTHGIGLAGDNDTSPTTLGYKASTPVTSSSSNVTLTSDYVRVQSVGTINTTGAVTVQPSSASFTSALTWPSPSAAYSVLTLNNVSGLTLGKSGNTANVSIDSGTSIAGPVNIYGGTVTLSNSLSTTNTSTGDVAITASGLTGSGGISLATGRGLTVSQSGPSTYSGAVSGTNATLTKVGSGTLTISGTNTYTGATTVSAGGLTTSGADKIADGSAVSVASSATLTLGGAETIGSLSGAASINLNSYTLTAGGDNTNTTYSGEMSGTGRLAKTGSGTLTLTANNTYSGGTEILDGTLVLSHNAPNPSGKTFTGTGSLRIEPASASFSSAFSTSGWSFANTLSSLTLGKSGNTANITAANAISIAGPISVYGGDITIDAGLAATGTNTVTLTGSGAVTDGASGFVTADKLALLGGNVTLDSTSNAIGTLAASGVGSLTYVDSNALTIGTVNPSGIAATGPVSISTLTGDLTVSQNITTTNTSASAIVLNAGKNTAAGTATGGNILIGSNPTLTVGSGGRATLYSGSVAGSTGLTALVGSGSGRFRYNSDEAASNYGLALNTGLNAIYRERPTLTVTADNETITYSTAPSLSVSINSQNGDMAAHAFSVAPAVAVGGTSTSGNYTVGTHALTASAGTDQLGYTISYTPGTLTVKPAAVPVVILPTLFAGTGGTGQGGGGASSGGPANTVEGTGKGAGGPGDSGGPGKGAGQGLGPKEGTTQGGSDQGTGTSEPTQVARTEQGSNTGGTEQGGGGASSGGPANTVEGTGKGAGGPGDSGGPGKGAGQGLGPKEGTDQGGRTPTTGTPTTGTPTTGTPTTGTPTTGTPTTEAPTTNQPTLPPVLSAGLPLAGAATSDSSSSSGSPLGGPTVGQGGIQVSLVRPLAVRQDASISVTVPKDTTIKGVGFGFPLPAQVSEAIPEQATIRVTTLEGAPLPAWLRYSPDTRSFTASAVPDGSLPFQVIVSAGQQRAVVVISERSE